MIVKWLDEDLRVAEVTTWQGTAKVAYRIDIYPPIRRRWQFVEDTGYEIGFWLNWRLCAARRKTKSPWKKQQPLPKAVISNTACSTSTRSLRAAVLVDLADWPMAADKCTRCEARYAKLAAMAARDKNNFFFLLRALSRLAICIDMKMMTEQTTALRDALGWIFEKEQILEIRGVVYVSRMLKRPGKPRVEVVACRL